MSEIAKTFVYVAVAVAVLGVAYFTRPRTDTQVELPEIVGKSLFEEFTDTDKASSLEIVRFDDELSELRPFKVEKDPKTGAWTIPTHAGYPANAENQMRDTAAIFTDLKVLDVKSELESKQSEYGVLEPDAEQLKVGTKGVGIKVTILDDKDDKLANLIIGNSVRDADDKRYVRIPGEDPIYTVKLDPSKLTTTFDDWIKKDLLDLNSMDIEDIKIRDYSVVRSGVTTFQLQSRSDIAVAWNSGDSKWELKELVGYASGGQPVKSSLLDGEEANAEKLNDLKSALDDLEIVDVLRKPTGLDAELAAGQALLQDEESINSLFQKGFFPFRNALKSANGEIIVTLKDGVKYILRFGKIAGADSESKNSSLNRYLFVTAQADPAKFPDVELEDLPPKPAIEGLKKPSDGKADETKADESKADESKADESKADETKADETKADETKADETKADETKADETKADETKADETKADETKADETKADETKADETKADETKANETKADETKADETKADETKADETKADETKADESKAEVAEKAEDKGTDDQDAKLAAWEAERSRIMKENQRKVDERNEKMKKAEQRVRELNAKFAPWYYVISEDVYKKIHLNRNDVIKEGDVVKKEGFGVDALRELEKSGLKKGADEEDAGRPKGIPGAGGLPGLGGAGPPR